MDPNYGHRGYHILTDVSSFHRKGHCLPGKLFSLQKKETGHKGDSYRFQSLKVFQPWQSIWKAAKITGCCLCSFHKVIFTILQPLSLFSSLLPLPFLLLFPLHLSMSSPPLPAEQVGPSALSFSPEITVLRFRVRENTGSTEHSPSGSAPRTQSGSTAGASLHLIEAVT